MAEIQVKKVRPMAVMSLAFTGSYAQTPERLQELMAWLLRAGHPCSDYPFGLFYDDPTQVAEDALRAEVCLPIEEECEPGDNIQRKALPGATLACATHHGPYHAMRPLYQEVFAWVSANGYRFVEGQPVREVYLTVYGQASDPAEFVTEVQVPVEKL